MINIRIQNADVQKLTPKITVIGVGGAGGNAVNNMINAGLQGADFLVCNTDAQALEGSLCDTRLQLGVEVTGGLGAGALLVATLKQGGGVQAWNLASGEVVMQEKSSTTVTHGVVVSPDSRYAFVSSEGVGAAPGKVDVYDLHARTRVASVEVGQQAGGIAFWKMEKTNR